MKEACIWCSSIIEAPPDYDPKTTRRLFCCQACMVANWMFEKLYAKGVINVPESHKETNLAQKGKTKPS